MTVEPAQRRLLADLTAMLLDVTGEDERWGARVTAASRLEADLRLDSLEVAALCGAGVDLAGYLAGLEIDEIIALTVGDVLGYVGGARSGRWAGSCSWSCRWPGTSIPPGPWARRWPTAGTRSPGWARKRGCAR